jgi:putative mobilization protein
MSIERKRNCLIKFYVTEEEKKFIFDKMKAAGIKNLSAYMRKISIDGKIEIHDMSGIKEMNYNLRKIGLNINQIAKRINETNTVFREDIRDIQNKQEEIWQLQKFIISNAE